MRSAFEEKLRSLINCESMENGSNTPDFILRDYLLGALDLFDRTVTRREDWFGRTQPPREGHIPAAPSPETGTAAGPSASFAEGSVCSFCEKRAMCVSSEHASICADCCDFARDLHAESAGPAPEPVTAMMPPGYVGSGGAAVLAATPEPVKPNCPKCGTHVTSGYGLMGGGIGAYQFCCDDNCDYFSKTQDENEDLHRGTRP